MITETLDRNILLYNTQEDHRMPSDYIGRYHIHILCHKGKAQFSFMDKTFTIEPDDWTIWQMSSKISDVLYSSDFDADFLLVDKDFLLEYNPEKIWAAKAFVFIKKHPVYRLDDKGLAMVEYNFTQFRRRIAEPHLFQEAIVGRQLQIFLFDLWEIYKHAIENGYSFRENLKGNVANGNIANGNVANGNVSGRNLSAENNSSERNLSSDDAPDKKLSKFKHHEGIRPNGNGSENENSETEETEKKNYEIKRTEAKDSETSFFSMGKNSEGFSDNSTALLFTRFMNLLAIHSKTEREVAFYADKLCVSPKYLSEVVKKSSGHPASYWINGFAMQEVLALLKRFDLTFAEIADEMNFYNPAHFTRFVKKQMGLSPTELRLKMERNMNSKSI